jgi:hypothetical protein
MIKINWTPTVRSSVRHLSALPSLVHLVVRRVTVSKLEHFTALLPPNLKRLTVDWVSIRDDDAAITHAIDMENDQVTTQNPRQLEYLKLQNTPAFFNWLLGEQSDIDVSNIHTLDICNKSTDISKLVRRVGSSLEHLKMSYRLSKSYCLDHQLFFE